MAEYSGFSELLSAAELNVPTLNASDDVSFLLKISNVTGFLARPHIVRSVQYHCRGLKFQLVENVRNEGSIAAYISRTENGNEFDAMDIVATCELSILDQDVGNVAHRQVFTYCFQCNDCAGYGKWMSVKCLQQFQAKGLGVTSNDTLVIRVILKAEPPHFNSNVSKKLTGYVGILNHGNTCYLNSVLQTLFFISKFRSACAATDGKDVQELKNVFHQLANSDSAVSTIKLTQSSSWTDDDSLLQQDVQEVFRWLIEKVEIQMKNKSLESLVHHLFGGHISFVVKCRDISFSSQSEEFFYDIQLNIEDSLNVYEALRRYISPSMLDGDNKNDTGGNGLQIAEQRVSFKRLPSVMVFHFVRFHFDKATRTVTKVNNVFEYTPTLDLQEFVPADQQPMGTKIIFVNPGLKGTWLKFDNELVSIVSPFDAINSNFGCEDDWAKAVQPSAYMLVYVRDIKAADVFERI